MRTPNLIFDYLTKWSLKAIELAFIALLIFASLVGSNLYGVYSERIITRHEVGIAVAQTLGMPPNSLISEVPMCLSTGCITYLYFATPMDEAQLLKQARNSPYGFKEYAVFEDCNRNTVPDIANHEIVFVTGQVQMPSPRTLRFGSAGQFPSPNTKPFHFIDLVFFPAAKVPNSYIYQGKPFAQNVVELYVGGPEQ